MSLSDKINRFEIELRSYLQDEEMSIDDMIGAILCRIKQIDEEFIKDLKEELCLTEFFEEGYETIPNEINRRIDALAGKELTEEQSK